jgi:hypothetical protein
VDVSIGEAWSQVLRRWIALRVRLEVAQGHESYVQVGAGKSRGPVLFLTLLIEGADIDATCFYDYPFT